MSGLSLVNLCLDLDAIVSQKGAEVQASRRVETGDIVTAGKLSRWWSETYVVFMRFESSVVNCLGIGPGRIRLLQKGAKQITTRVWERNEKFPTSGGST